MASVSGPRGSSLAFRVNAPKKGLDVYSVDVIVTSSRQQAPHAAAAAASGVTSRPYTDAADHLEHHVLAEPTPHTTTETSTHALKLLLPARNGHVARSDLVAFRLRGVDVACESFVEPRQAVQAAVVTAQASSWDVILSSAVGTLLLPGSVQSDAAAQQSLDQLEAHLEQRLAIPWLLPDPIPYKRVALVGGLEENESFAAVKAIGVGLIVLDKPGNYLEDPNGPYAHLREEFIPFNMNPDQGTAQRIFDALKDKKVDGIHTRYDIHHTNVARACKMLGLPTSEPDSYATATDKYAARALEDDGVPAIRVKDAAELLHRLPELKLEYPLIVKPTTGRNSWGVLRCDNQEQLVEAAHNAHDRVIGALEDGTEMHSDVMVESYIDGPEFDVDMVLWNGELLFSEVSDNFPCAGDIPEDAPAEFSHQSFSARDFQEVLFVYPSILVPDEQKLLVESLHRTLLRLGFRNGCFHVEARVRNSSMEYSLSDGYVDLRLRDDAAAAATTNGNSYNGTTTNETTTNDTANGTINGTTTRPKPSCFLIEANPRPPGYLSLLRAGWMYGIDYWTLHVLRCLGDAVRFRALATPRPRVDGHVCALHFIMPERGGVLRSPDPGLALAQRRPELMAHVPLYFNEFEPGQHVPPPVSTNFLFLTRMNVETYKGRADLLRVIGELRREFRFDIGDE